MHLQGNVHVLPHASYLAYLHTKVRDQHADLSTFTHLSDQVVRQLMNYSAQPDTTLIGDVNQGKCFQKAIVASAYWRKYGARV